MRNHHGCSGRSGAVQQQQQQDVTRKRNLLDSFQRLADLNGRPRFKSSVPPERDESVGAKWEDLRRFEEEGGVSGGAPDSSYGSLASSSSSSSGSVEAAASSAAGAGAPPSSGSKGANGGSGLSARERFLKLKKDGWRQLKSQLLGKRRKRVYYKSGSNVAYGEVVSTSPDGVCADPCPPSSTSMPPDPSRLGSVLPKIRSSRSMQNLEQATRGSYLNLRDLTAEWKHKYHSRSELRESRSRSVYQALDHGGEDDDDDEGEVYDDDFKLRGIR